MLGRVEALLVRLLLGSRWVMAPLCLGLVAALLVVLVEFFLPDEPTAGTVGPGPPRSVDISALKLKVFGSISAIAAIEVLESFVNIESVDKQNVLWEILILLTLVVSGLLLAWMDRLGHGGMHAGR